MVVSGSKGRYGLPITLQVTELKMNGKPMYIQGCHSLLIVFQ